MRSEKYGAELAEFLDRRGGMDKQPPRDIRERTFEFACAIVKFCRTLGTTPGVQRHIAGQLLNAGTPVGANVEEAKGA